MTIKKLIDDTGISVSEFARRCKTTRQRLSSWANGKSQGRFIVFLCRIRKVSKQSWNEFGKMLDDSYLNKDGK